jgi:hypothetical protein
MDSGLKARAIAAWGNAPGSVSTMDSGLKARATVALPLTTYHLPLTTYHLPLTTYHLPLTTQRILSPILKTTYAHQPDKNP